MAACYNMYFWTVYTIPDAPTFVKTKKKPKKTKFGFETVGETRE